MPFFKYFQLLIYEFITKNKIIKTFKTCASKRQRAPWFFTDIRLLCDNLCDVPVF